MKDVLKEDKKKMIVSAIKHLKVTEETLKKDKKADF